MKNVFLDPRSTYWSVVSMLTQGFSVTSVYLLWRRNGENRQVQAQSRNLVASPNVLYFSAAVLHSSKI